MVVILRGELWYSATGVWRTGMARRLNDVRWAEEKKLLSLVGLISEITASAGSGGFQDVTVRST